jgi:hypothetical protein
MIRHTQPTLCVRACVCRGGVLVVLVLHVALPGVGGQGDALTPVLAGFGKDFDMVHSLVVPFEFVGLVQKYRRGCG